jgi:hypothetical protein
VKQGPSRYVLYSPLAGFHADPGIGGQLLIDLQAIKACLTKLPGESLTSARFVDVSAA